MLSRISLLIHRQLLSWFAIGNYSRADKTWIIIIDSTDSTHYESSLKNSFLRWFDFTVLFADIASEWKNVHSRLASKFILKKTTKSDWGLSVCCPSYNEKLSKLKISQKLRKKKKEKKTAIKKWLSIKLYFFINPPNKRGD